MQRGCIAESPLRPNPSWAFSPSGAAFTQIHALRGLPHHLQAQVTIYNAETTRKYSAKDLQRRQASPGCPRITSRSASSSPLCSNCMVPDMHPQAHPTTDPPGCPSSLQGDAIAQSQGVCPYHTSFARIPESLWEFEICRHFPSHISYWKSLQLVRCCNRYRLVS